ncbi:phosphopantetheine-binding protein [Blautia producta]|uniref:phosphopantetheine-binding protein n=1 Tax=Blautia producta TaxID=33035 RepID=UPI00210D548C|nr:phosphopantetheine-binding protein [Blautia producta]MCQ4744253.1 phosphopantetheine-binding protein [Blautia producta]
MLKEKIKNSVIEIIVSLCSKEIDFQKDINLIDEHVLDSVVFVQMISLIEKEFNIKFSLFDLDIQNFKSVNSIVSTVTEVIQNN